MKHLLPILLLLGGTAHGAEPTTHERGDLAIRARGILLKYCAGCHAPDRQTFDILDYTQVTDPKHPVPFAAPGNPAASQIIQFIEDGSMPPGGKARPTEAELGYLKQWLTAQAPRYPKTFDEPTTLTAILDDWKLQKQPDHVRYVSFAHTIRDDREFVGLGSIESRLRAGLAASTGKSHTVELQPVDEAATIYRLNVEKLGWLAPELFEQIDLNGVPSAVEFRPFELILLENPFPVRDPRFATLLGKSLYSRPVPLLRGDWLADVLAPESPLAADLAGMVELADAKETPCGPKLRPLQPIKSAAAQSATPPLTAWYGGDRPDPLNLRLALKGKTAPYRVKISEPIPLELTADRPGRFVLLNRLSDGSLRIQPTAGGNVLKKGEPFPLLAPNGKPITIPSIISGADSAVEDFIAIAADEDVPLPVILRSIHLDGCVKTEGRAPVWRFAFTTDAKFDPARAARIQIAITVSGK